MILLCGLYTMAQDGVWTFSGKVVDAKTRKALSYVSVTDRNVGTVTNAEGEFTLKLKAEPTAVTFSCLGYRTQRLTAAECKALEAEKKAVQMQASSVVLSEIVVKGVDNPRQLVERAIDKIDDNYPRTPSLLRGFYRETTQKRNRFISVSEGVVDVYKSPYFRLDWRDGVAILKGRRLLSQRKGDTLAVKLQGGPVLPVHLDVVKEREILLNYDELNNYHFTYKGMKQTGDRTAFVIEIKPALILDYPLYNGKLYIDQETLAFTKIELDLDMSDEQKATQSILRKKPVGLRFTPHEMSINIDYKTDNGVTRINYIRNVIRFRCDWKRKLFKSNFTVVSEMVVTDRTEGEDVKPIKGRDTFNRRDNFYDKVIYFEDPYFWGDENIIEPTEDLLEGIEKIKQKLKR
jgi:hypothetical protein